MVREREGMCEETRKSGIVEERERVGERIQKKPRLYRK